MLFRSWSVTYEVRLVRVDVSDEHQKRSRFLQKANIEYLNLVAPWISFFFWFFSQKHNLKATKKKRTAPCIVLTSNCQFLIIFKYVIELEELVKASPRRIWPRARVRVSKRRTEPLREPVNTRNCQWLTSKLDQTMFFHNKHGPTSS